MQNLYFKPLLEPQESNQVSTPLAMEKWVIDSSAEENIEPLIKAKVDSLVDATEVAHTSLATNTQSNYKKVMIV